MSPTAKEFGFGLNYDEEMLDPIRIISVLDVVAKRGRFLSLFSNRLISIF